MAGSLLVDTKKHFSKIVGLDSLTVKNDLDHILKSLTVGEELVQVAQELKQSDPNLKLYIMSNISREHFEIVQRGGLPWSMFDSIFISGALGMQKPDIGFFQRVVSTIGIDPNWIVMVDDRAANIRAARSLGMHGVLVDKPLVEISQSLRNLFLNSSENAESVGEHNKHLEIDVV
ncbi:HAD-like domain-containing protein [Hypoxylon trugodes]|uniref:HAD-like domain-containing protein n=1 Tax=Hypoxylon trugodes TaxID=326681 RepID=UPI00219955D6|nr:HAD-like domain-containing protein [Hypoxylon trugodes]KAI1386806.1 HAD-like domain-containing protein [Hypoxylon trugodes]